jgi:hypothetical protein
VILAMRPRLVVYNATLDALRPVLSSVVGRLDPAARWAGRSVVLPSVGIELHLETSDYMHNVLVIATGSEQNLAAWRELEDALRQELDKVAVVRGARGVCFLAFAAALLISALSHMVLDPQAVAMGVSELLRP